MVKVGAFSALAAGLGLWLAGQANAQSTPVERPAHAHVSNQELANNVASALERSGNLHGYTIDIKCQNGVVELSGKISDEPQREAVISTVLTQSGVKSVIDGMAANFQAVRPVQALSEPVAGPPPAGPAVLPPPNVAGPIVDPVPLGQPGASSPYDLAAPKMPTYAWSSYAPYNNFSRVAYPQNYPYNSFPFIGPFYPFPKVPLGWRSVTLEWQDGHWWMGRNATKYDYWRVRYW